jgi:glutaminyl-tRNA synthetase
MTTVPNPDSSTLNHFVKEIIQEDLKNKKVDAIVTRFPPEPNGYLHIGHAKAICLDFGMALEFGGRCHLRMDDTNPAKESMEYVEAIKRDIKWLGFDWGEHFYYASDFFEKMYELAEELIRRNLAYVCELSMEEWKEYRGIPERPGRESPYRNRPIEESLLLFSKMRAGEFPDGSKCLRAKIDMANPNLHMRDPVLYRIMRVPHYRSGNKWCIYPTYDFAHPLEDAFEEITHSLCTLEFEVHRPLYEWVVSQLKLKVQPRQIEFARLNLSYTVMSKRKLLALVQEGIVKGWDDPRMPTLAGLRRRGVPPAAIRNFCVKIGITKYESLTDIALLEHSIREELNRHAQRAMAVFNPIKLIIDNYPPDKMEYFELPNNPEDRSAGTRKVPFSRELFIEADDFMENPPKQFFRLYPGNEVRLRGAYCVKCVSYLKDSNGKISEIHAEYDPTTAGGANPKDRKIKATIHWVSIRHAFKAKARLYDRLFMIENPGEVENFLDCINQKSFEEAEIWCEPFLLEVPISTHLQFERVGYFFVDPMDSSTGKPVFNRTTTLKDSWAKIKENVLK